METQRIVETAAGKVQSILISGDRSTPMGLLHFVGQVGSLLFTMASY
jgi:hypothetical protein